jgi:hypothetical protein
MRKLIARVFDYSLDGVIATEAYQSMASYFPAATGDPNAHALNAGRKVVFSRTLNVADWANTTIAGGDLGPEVGKLRQGGDGYIVVHGGPGQAEP